MGTGVTAKRDFSTAKSDYRHCRRPVRWEPLAQVIDFEVFQTRAMAMPAPFPIPVILQSRESPFEPRRLRARGSAGKTGIGRRGPASTRSSPTRARWRNVTVPKRLCPIRGNGWCAPNAAAATSTWSSPERSAVPVLKPSHARRSCCALRLDGGLSAGFQTFARTRSIGSSRPRLCENSRVQFARRKFFSICPI
jgi:hypothetical protein